MARQKVDVTFGSPERDRIPDVLVEGASTMVGLENRGALGQVAERLRIRRQGGFCGLDVFVFLWLYVSAGASWSIRDFWLLVRPSMRGLAALARRTKLASSSAMSRALCAVELDLLRPVTGWLLAQITGVDALLRHRCVQTFDARGEGWHVFDVDPKVVTLHHRPLPRGEELPEPVCRSEGTGAPGYSGRKRGELQYRQVPAMHAGGGVWVHGHLSPGNGEGVADLELALDGIVATCARLEHPLERALVRLDGEHGNVPWFTACRERGVPFLTRLNRPKLYEDPEVLATLRAATWHLVPDSGSGPQRSATDLGVLTLAAGKQTLRADGSAYEPVTVRVVAVIFPKRGEAKRGRVLDGWQVELFAVDLPADRWPAAEAIGLYYARNGFENRLAQQDRELGLGRIACYHLPGQELATVVGMANWHERVVRGFELERPPEQAPVQQLHTPVVDERVPASWPRDPVLQKQLAALDWARMLVDKPGWSFDAASSELHCEQERPLTLTTVRPRPGPGGRTGLIFRRPTHGCEPCPSRPGCLLSERPEASKHVEFSIDAEGAAHLRDRLARVRTPDTDTIAPIAVAPGPLAIAHALFLPAEARHAHREVFLGATLRVEVTLPPPPPPRPRLVAASVGHRQRRRQTWAQKVARYALPTEATTHLQVNGSKELHARFAERALPNDGVSTA